MELKEGMYVRTKDGLIAKCLKHGTIEDDNEYSVYSFDSKIYWFYEYYNDYVYEEDFKRWFENEVIKEPSYNIIDLIEVGDYVNGMQVSRICFDEDGGRILNFYGSILELINEDIKSIVTKEQFESMSYKVGDSE